MYAKSKQYEDTIQCGESQYMGDEIHKTTTYSYLYALHTQYTLLIGSPEGHGPHIWSHCPHKGF